jgi:long-chain acyl-CoA synthetase
MAERIWQQSYSAGIPFEIDLSDIQSISEMFALAVHEYGGRTAFSSFGSDLTFREVDRHSRDFAAYLQNHLGLKKGDRVAMMAPNTLVFAVGMFGVIRAGGVQVNVNPLYSPRELEHQLRDADTETIIVFSGSTSTLAEVIDRTPVRNVIVFGLDDLVNRGLPSPPADQRLQDTTAFIETLARGAELDYVDPGLAQDDLLFLQYTGGTTGLSKGAMLTHGNLLANIKQFEAVACGMIENGSEVVLTAIPMYHIFALMVNTLSFFRWGGKNVLVTDPRQMGFQRHRLFQPQNFDGRWGARATGHFTKVERPDRPLHQGRIRIIRDFTDPDRQSTDRKRIPDRNRCAASFDRHFPAG